MSTSSSSLSHRHPLASSSDIAQSVSASVPSSSQSYLGSCWKSITHKAASYVPNISEQTIWRAYNAGVAIFVFVASKTESPEEQAKITFDVEWYFDVAVHTAAALVSDSSPEWIKTSMRYIHAARLGIIFDTMTTGTNTIPSLIDGVDALNHLASYKFGPK